MPRTLSPAIALSTMDRCMGSPSSSFGSARKSSNLNQRWSSLRGSWRSRHQSQAELEQASSRRRRTILPASGNWWRTHGGMTEFPPDTDSQARTYASSQPLAGASAITSRARVRQDSPSSRARIALYASLSDGIREPRSLENTISKPAPFFTGSQPVPRGQQVGRHPAQLS